MKSFSVPFVMLSFILKCAGQSPADLMRVPAGPPAKPEEIIVTVNGVPIREQKIIEEADFRIDQDNARDAAMGLVFEENTRPVARQFVRQDVIHTLVERELIAQQLKADKIEVSEDEVEARLQEKKRELEQMDKAGPVELSSLAARSTRERVSWNILGVEKLYQVHAKDKKTLSEAEMQQEYDRYQDQFDVPEERRVSHILFAVNPEASPEQKKAARTNADSMLKRIRAGEDFVALAKAHSDDATSKLRGGDRGWSTRGFVTSPTDDPFGNVAFSMKQIGGISDVVETKDGFHIIQLTGIKPARKKTFDEAKRQLTSRFKYLEIQRFWQEFGGEMWASAKIETTAAEQARKVAAEKRQREFNERVEAMIAREQEKQRHEASAAPTPSAVAPTEP